MTKTVMFGAGGFLFGVAVAALVLLNPLGWAWLPGFVSGSDAATSAAAFRAPAGPPGEREIVYWRSPMDPTITSPEPRTDAMGMEYVPVYADDTESPPAGTIRIDPTFVQNIGVQSEPVRRVDIPFTIRTVGTLTYNDAGMTWINTKYEGWIESVAVNYIGEPVSRGQTLFEIYSPQLVTTQKEYLQAVDYAERLGSSRYPEIAARARALLASARERLRYWDITDAQIDQIEASGDIRRTLAVTSPVDGIVVEKMDQALEGMHVTPGMNLYKLADLSTIWVEVEIFEHQVPWLRLGQTAQVELPYTPGRVYTGRVRYLYPFFSERTRTMKVSIELQNPDQLLRANMFANVTFEVPSAQDVLAVPEEAVIRSGTRDILVLDRGAGSFEVVEVTLGMNGSGLWEVRDGIEEGDRVVVSSQFLIDSESNLKEAIRKITSTGGEGATEPAAGNHAAQPATGDDAAPAAGPSHQH